MSTYETYRRSKSAVAFALCVVFTVGILAILVFVTWYLVSTGFHSLSLNFFISDTTERADNAGGMRPALLGTGILIALASVVGIPIGMLTGVFLSEYASNSWLATPVRFICDVVAGVPSIVVGILGYELIVVPMGHKSGWAGALGLAFIMIPIVARTTEEMLRLVPGSYREASIALGATKAWTILRVVIPSATGSLVTGVMLAIARVAGETAPLLFTAGMSRYVTLDPNIEFPSLTRQIYDYSKGNPPQQQLAWAGILVLIAMIFVLNLLIRLATRTPRTQPA
jgi:phosphate transport system permease protein